MSSNQTEPAVAAEVTESRTRTEVTPVGTVQGAVPEPDDPVASAQSVAAPRVLKETLTALPPTV